MGTTPTYGLRYQELGDAPDGAALGENLAADVEAELERIDAAATQQAQTHTTDVEAIDGRLTELEGQLVQSGTVAVNMGGTDSSTAQIAFPVAFSAAPVVTVAGNFRDMGVNISSAPDVNGCQVRVFTTDGGTSGATVTVYWIAVGAA